MTDPYASLFAELHGRQLSAITFVQDYLQLWFDGPGINVTNPLTVRTAVEDRTDKLSPQELNW